MLDAQVGELDWPNAELDSSKNSILGGTRDRRIPFSIFIPMQSNNARV
jgi:hypothetical protein